MTGYKKNQIETKKTDAVYICAKQYDHIPRPLLEQTSEYRSLNTMPTINYTITMKTNSISKTSKADRNVGNLTILEVTVLVNIKLRINIKTSKLVAYRSINT